MQVADRGDRRTSQGVLWALLAAALFILGAVLFAAGGGFAGILIAGVLIAIGIYPAVKAYGAFTGVKRFGKPS